MAAVVGFAVGPGWANGVDNLRKQKCSNVVPEVSLARETSNVAQALAEF